MSPQDYMEFAKLAIMGLAILIPVTGVTARFALRPFAEAMARLRAGDPQQGLEQRVSRIEAEVGRLGELRDSIDRLAEELEFNRKLALPRAQAVPASGRTDA